MSVEMKTCTKCATPKPATTEYFYKAGKPRKDGSYALQANCIDCAASYYQKNRQARLGYQEDWNKKNPVRHRANWERAQFRSSTWFADAEDAAAWRAADKAETQRILAERRAFLEERGVDWHVHGSWDGADAELRRLGIEPVEWELPKTMRLDMEQTDEQ
jgi:hypothetical protein